jgi:hypothetical protein
MDSKVLAIADSFKKRERSQLDRDASIVQRLPDRPIANQAYADCSLRHTERSAGFLEQFKNSVPQLFAHFQRGMGGMGAENGRRELSNDVIPRLSAPIRQHGMTPIDKSPRLLKYQHG